MFIIFKDGSTADVSTSRVEFKDGIAFGISGDTWDQSVQKNVPVMVAAVSMEAVRGVFPYMPLVVPPPAPTEPIAVTSLRAENDRMISALKKLRVWASQSPTGPAEADGVAKWVRDLIDEGLGCGDNQH